jgi:hypothetical protein
MIISLVEAGVAKREAIERALERFPHLCPQEAEEEHPSAPPEAPAEPEMLTGETLRRALFRKLCELFLSNPENEEEIACVRGYFNGCINGKKLPGMLLTMLIQPEELEYLWAAFPNATVTASALSGKNLPLLIGTARGMGYSFARDRLSEQTHAAAPDETPADEAQPEEAPAERVSIDDIAPGELFDDPAWAAQLCCCVPDAERAREGRPNRDVSMLWGFVRDALRPGLNTARRQHLDALEPAWHPARPRELVLLASTSYTVRFTNLALAREINEVIGKLLNRFFDCARPVFVPQEVIEQIRQRREQEARS